MAAPGRIEEWFQQVPEVLLEEGGLGREREWKI